MPESTESRLAALVQRVTDLAADVAELRDIRRDDHHRLRSVEAAVQTMIDAQKTARSAEARQYQRLGTKIAVAGLLLATASLLSPILVAVLINH